MGLALPSASHAEDDVVTGSLGMVVGVADHRSEWGPWRIGGGVPTGRVDLPLGSAVALSASASPGFLAGLTEEGLRAIFLGWGRVDLRATAWQTDHFAIAPWISMVGPKLGPMSVGVSVRSLGLWLDGVGMAGLSVKGRVGQWRLAAGAPAAFLWMGHDIDFDEPVVMASGGVVDGAPVALVLAELRAERELGTRHTLVLGIQEASPGVGWAVQAGSLSIEAIVQGMPRVPLSEGVRSEWVLGGVTVEAPLGRKTGASGR